MKLRDEWKWLALLAAVSIVVFANTVGGEFIYDDTRQILRNSLIQDNSLIWKALTSDVWAFKGDGSMAASNYWRPTFTAWHILNFRFFGTAPIGWHIANLILHTGICILVFGLLRRWAFVAFTAFAIAVIFAVHPVHVESVAWISGSPDLLFAAAFLGSLWFAQSYAETGSRSSLILTILLYAAALGAKEIAILCLPIIYLVMVKAETEPEKSIDRKWPMLILSSTAAIYFVLRWLILGAISRPPDDPVSLGSALLSIPAMFAFYQRQIFFPYWLGANYPLEPVVQPELANFAIPIAVSATALLAIYYLIKSNSRGWLAAALFFLPLITAMNATAFVSQQIVHDRYLYLPLLGMLMLIVPLASKLAGERTVLIISVVISAVLSVQSITYNRAWADELSVWTRTAAIDNSSFTLMQYGNALAEAGRDQDSIITYTAAIEKKPVQRGFIGRGRGYLKLKQYQNAEADLIQATQFSPEESEAYALYQAYEALGITYVEQRKYEAAIKNFADAREQLPMYYAALTVNIAVVRYMNAQKEDALRELETAKQQARNELLPESKSVFLRLGMLYYEGGRKDEARNALREYLSLTEALRDKATLANRTQARKLLDSIK